MCYPYLLNELNKKQSNDFEYIYMVVCLTDPNGAYSEKTCINLYCALIFDLAEIMRNVNSLNQFLHKFMKKRIPLLQQGIENR